jgi:two-component system nitrogen regulation response regulator NtrX
LEKEIAAGRFREDLYYRLNVIPFHVPPLRERTGDIPVLARAFVEEFCAESGTRPKAIAPRAMARLEAYAWPGNVRELRNLIERVVILTPGIAHRALTSRDAQGRAAPGNGDRAAASLGQSAAVRARGFCARASTSTAGASRACAGRVSIARRACVAQIKTYGLEASAAKRAARSEA